ncbi:MULTISPECIES: MFS transporter [Micrococcaceae]|uniref:MFS transporter n=1 Tax=Micrococcaceae TaxID=1268 RepID=UPI001CFF6A39|nr:MULTISPECIES: MFS transporter [Micrococcaceae]MCB5283942.1 putative transporter YycB [Arthrobacter sp. ES1]MDJ0353939.1 MFS transporter [Pseudarthrobacter sp. PH31-O2]WGZ80965.1 MFS transporter [Arthrobacter sp. EM1]
MKKIPRAPWERPRTPAASKIALTLVALSLVSINLRPAITTIAGSMGQLEQGLGIAAPALPLLAALPVLAFGMSAPCGPWLARRLGAGTAIALAMLLLALALVARVLVPALLLPGTFVAGMAIMAASVLLPQVVKANQGNGWWTGLCSMGFGLGAALGAGLIQPLQHALDGSLNGALAIWAVPAVLAAILMLQHGGVATGPAGTLAAIPPSNAFSSGSSRAGAERLLPAARALRSQGTAWAVTAFFGLQAMLYFAVTSWLTVFLVSKGLTAGDAAAHLAWFSVAGLPASLLAPVLASRPAVLKIMAPGLGMFVAAALLGVLAGPAEFQFLLIGVLGVVQSAGLGLGLALVVLRSTGPQTAGSLSAMSQGLGFALASLGPVLAALIHDVTGGWEAAFWALAGVAMLLSLAGYFSVSGRIVSADESTVFTGETRPAGVGS